MVLGLWSTMVNEVGEVLKTEDRTDCVADVLTTRGPFNWSEELENRLGGRLDGESRRFKACW